MKHLWSFVVGFLLLYSCALFAQQLEIHHIDVGQADATLIKSPTGVTLLIDGGNTGNGTNIIRPYLTSLGISTLNFVVCSHYHADHLGGLDEVINGLGVSNIGSVYDRGSDAPLPTTVGFTDYASAANATGRRYKIALGQVLDLGGGVSMKCVATDGEVINYGVVSKASGSENDLSVGWLLTYNTFQYFTGGDLGGEASSYADNETPLAPQVGDVDVMKINHHASQYSTNQTFVNALKPEVAVIEVGNGNSYGHPTQVVLDRLGAANCYIYQTELGSGGTIPSGKGVVANGNIIVKTSGTSYTVTYGSTTNTYPGDGGTADVTPPVISAVTSSAVSATSAVISWTTDESSSSVVEYGLTTSYGSTKTGGSGVTSHSVTLTGLTSGTVYHYRVTSADAANNASTSPDHSFQTGSSFSYAPTATTITSGSLSSGTYTNLATNNASYYVVKSTTSGTRKIDWYGKAIVSQAPTSVSQLVLTYDGKNSASKTQVLYLYNWTTAAWTQINSRSVGTTDVTVTYTQTSPANYISTSGEVRLRVYASGGTSNFTCSGDFMQFNVETAGSSLAKPMAETPAIDTKEHREGATEQSPGSRLLSNFPNPFNPSTTIRYELMQNAHVQVDVYDIRGAKVRELVNGVKAPGFHDVRFDASSLASGMYYARFIASPLDGSKPVLETRKLLLMK